MAAEAMVPKVDKSTVVSVIVAVVILVIAYMAYNYFWGAKPAGALTQAEYDALDAAGKATYKMSGQFYVKA